MVVRRERPHPGERLDALATDTGVGQLARRDAGHRAHARVEDRIRCAEDTGLDHLPSRSSAIDSAWLSVVMLAVDLIAWTRHLLLHGDLAEAEPRTLRYRMLHVAARPARGQRRLRLRIRRSWPWAREKAAAFTEIGALPVPRGDLPCRHDERREPPAQRQAGHPATPTWPRSAVKIDQLDHEIS